MTAASGPMAARGTEGGIRAGGWSRPVLRLLFWLYAAGLIIWLVLGLAAFVARLPVLSGQVTALAAEPSAVGRFAARVLAADMADMPGTAQVALQYGFSLLNLVLGIVLAVRRPHDRVPRLLSFALLGTAATFNMPSHVVFHILGSPWPIALAHFTFHIVSGVCYLWAVVLFPDGSLPERIRLTGSRLGAVVAVVTVALVLVCWRSSFLAHPQFFVVFFGILVPVAGVAAMALRLRQPDESVTSRRTCRLLMAALLPALSVAVIWLGSRAIAVAGGNAATSADAIAGAVQAIFPAVFAVVPAVLFAGVVHYRLWDIDRLLSQVLCYGLIVLGVSAVYVTAVAVAGASFAGWWGVAAVALAAVLMEPARVLARGWANRVVYGRRLSPADAIRELINGFETLTAAGELEQLAAVTVAATRARVAAVWVAQEDRLVLAAVSPAGTGLAESAPLGDGRRSAGDLAMSECTPLVHGGELLGVLGVRADGNAVRAIDRALIEDLASHAGLVVHNALLTAELARRVADLADRTERLRRARRRLVTAQDAERRRLERDLHDGAQQSLVAVIVGLRSIGGCSGPVERATVLADLRAILGDARAALADLGGSAEPRALRERGLAAAISDAAALTRRAGPEVRVDIAGAAEIVPPVRSALYFSVVEALQNVAKYSSAHRVAVRLRRERDEARFEIADDGVGFDPASVGSDRGGLSQLALRLDPLGGWLQVQSAPGQGTRVLGGIPLPRYGLAASPGAVGVASSGGG